jgi:hypothetical protein
MTRPEVGSLTPTPTKGGSIITALVSRFRSLVTVRSERTSSSETVVGFDFERSVFRGSMEKLIFKITRPPIAVYGQRGTAAIRTASPDLDQRRVAYPNDVTDLKIAIDRSADRIILVGEPDGCLLTIGKGPCVSDRALEDFRSKVKIRSRGKQVIVVSASRVVHDRYSELRRHNAEQGVSCRCVGEPLDGVWTRAKSRPLNSILGYRIRSYCDGATLPSRDHGDVTFPGSN